MIDVLVGDAVQWASAYNGAKFHAILCDPPYHLASIVERFGGDDSAPARDRDGVFRRASRGFMGQQWDGGDVAFNPETWATFGGLLYPGGFGMAFAAARNYHRVAVAIEDAGFIIHPMIAWVNGQGFPKSTNLPRGIDRHLGVSGGSGQSRAGAYSSNTDSQGSYRPEYSEYIPASEEAKAFSGYRYGLQTLKPSVEPIVVFQKPYDGKPVADIIASGAGAINVDGSRIEGRPLKWDEPREGFWRSSNGTEASLVQSEQGRWPANVIFSHKAACKVVGRATIKGRTINRFSDGAKPWGEGAGHSYETEYQGDEEVSIWDCEPGCPVAALDRQSRIQSDEVISGGLMDGFRIGEPEASRFFFVFQDANIDQEYPFVYARKTGVGEREAGLEGESKERINNHPTLKSITLARYLATMLLPPAMYAPRRILVPFAGTMSEAIGAHLAGWDDVMAVELMEEYAEIGRKRIDHWTRPQDRQLRMI